MRKFSLHFKVYFWLTYLVIYIFLDDYYLELRKRCPCSELLLSVFSRIRTEYREILCISPYSVQVRENNG